MSFSCFIKLALAAIAASVVGFFIVNAINPSAMPAASLFATGIALGTIFGGLLVALYPGKSEESSSNNASSSGSTNIYVGNLPFSVGKEEITNIFKPYGAIIDIRLVKDRRSRRFKGYAFVEMAVSDAERAIKQLDNTDYAGRILRVNEAKERGEK